MQRKYEMGREIIELSLGPSLVKLNCGGMRDEMRSANGKTI